MGSLFRKKPLDTLLAQSQTKSLSRSLSAFDLVLLGIGCVIGTGIFVITGTVAATGAGPALILSFILAGLACALAAFCYAEFSSSIPVSGSVYTYSYATLGELLAFLIGWDLMLEYVIALAAVATGWSSYFQSLLAGFHLHIPAALTGAPGSSPGAVFNLPAAVIILIITAIVGRGVKESTRFNNVIVLMKIAIILLFIIVGIGYVKPDNWSPFMPFGINGVIASAATVFFAYLGFDAVSNASEEVKNPQKNMPIGIIGALAICTILYIAVSLVLTGMMPYTQLNVGDPVSFALKFVGQDQLAGIISVGAIVGITTVMLALLYAQVRLTFAMSRDGLLPALFAKVHPTFKTPFQNTWLTGIVAAGIAGFINLGTLAHLVNMGTLAAFTVISIAVIVLRKKHPDVTASFRVPFVPVVPIISAGLCLYLASSLPGVTWLSFVIWIAVGAVVYFLYSKKHSQLNN
ncbi:amino acid permease family protein [Bacillus atrophaeus subsp. globigii]|uniref:Metabolite permease n=3 Tax=Bacillus atrophaeus TaxID=1452 RepID=A0ABM5LTP6_BACA1|nr:amino acid permease [Bacillus atrophaeus]AMR63797.1 amino acid permease [Bacillus subtilis subsp. globigii]ADP31210.1 metabolite permease [Bacillus atrophaeus 1942]AIK47239.1 amino acid permease family protein [Bacillus atrophaeus subsp. globigii]KFK81147.1 amino acid permease family protein [Bacillus atrophaeus]MBG9758582.1 amino acid permease [Bacillus atrophaeus]